ncbi:MAG: hypothetical protein WCZ90_02490 [Melioribacteraceae bacterium]
MDKLLKKATLPDIKSIKSRFEKFNLSENPFPSEPVVNKDSLDKRINGGIFEIEIRKSEYHQIINNFIKQKQSNPNHLRLGFLMDTSYIGRGNGKSAFLINLNENINKEFSLDISNGSNKCFSVYFAPEPGGRTKTFNSFIDLLFDAIIKSNIINTSLAILRLEAINSIYPKFNMANKINNTEEIIELLNDEKWLTQNNLSNTEITSTILKNPHLQELPPEFPLYKGRTFFMPPFIGQDDFLVYYRELKKGKERFDFVFSHLISFFIAASFNGAYILVDDFERIPDFQSARQKRDFSLELRTALYDGSSLNAKLGFYNFILVLHAGVPRLISEAWSESGMENRVPIAPKAISKHIIPFEKLNKEHAKLLLQKYLSEYRIKPQRKEPLFPFTESAISKIGEFSEYNAATILRMAFDLIDKAADSESQLKIDDKFVIENRGTIDINSDSEIPKIKDADSIDLIKKANNEE